MYRSFKTFIFTLLWYTNLKEKEIYENGREKKMVKKNNKEWRMHYKIVFGEIIKKKKRFLDKILDSWFKFYKEKQVKKLFFFFKYQNALN